MSENTEGPQIITQGRRLFKHGKAIKRLYDLLWGTARDNQKVGLPPKFSSTLVADVRD
jgi:hypothetical protein